MLIAMNVNAQWVQISNGMNSGTTSGFAVIGTNLFAATGGGVCISTNNGNNWTMVNNGLTASIIVGIAVSGTNLFAISQSQGVFLSTNYGSSWTAVNNGITDLWTSAIGVSGTNIFVGTWNDGGIFLSTNNGTNWTAVNDGYPIMSQVQISSIVVMENKIFVGSGHLGVYLSTNNGSNWTGVNSGLNKNVRVLAVSGTNIFAGSRTVYSAIGGIYMSTNNGTNWNTKGLNGTDIRSLAASGTNIVAGTFSDGLFFSSNIGANWVPINQGFNGVPPIDVLFFINNYIFAGTGNQFAWRRPLSDLVEIQNISTETPSKYSLSQNYPNPFNSTSNLKFQISNTGNVKLIVYDIMGKEVQTLVNERLQPGTYEAAFDGSVLNSGVYFYRIVTEGYSETKRMLLIK